MISAISSAERLDEELFDIQATLTSLSKLLGLFSFQDHDSVTSPTSRDEESGDKSQENGNLSCEPNHNHIQVTYPSFTLTFCIISVRPGNVALMVRHI